MFTWRRHRMAHTVYQKSLPIRLLEYSNGRLFFDFCKRALTPMKANLKSQFKGWSYNMQVLIMSAGWSLTLDGYRMFEHPIKALIHKYDSAFSTFLPFLIQDPSAISAASAIITCSSLRVAIIFERASPFRTGAGPAIVNECNQIIQTAHRIRS